MLVWEIVNHLGLCENYLSGILMPQYVNNFIL